MATIINDNTVITTIKEKNKFCKNNEAILNNIFNNIIEGFTNKYGIESLCIESCSITVELSKDVTFNEIHDFVKSYFDEYNDLFKHICGINMIRGTETNVFNIWRKR